MSISQTENGDEVSVEKIAGLRSSEGWGLDSDIRIHEFVGEIVLDDFVDIGEFLFNVFREFFPANTSLFVLYTGNVI